MGISAVVGSAVVGAGTAAYGAYEKSQGQGKAEDAANQQSMYAQQQAAIASAQSAIAGQQAQLGASHAISQSALQSQYAISQAQLQAGFATGQAQTSAQFATQEGALNIEGAQATLAASEQSFQINQGIIGAQQNIEGQRMQAMEMDARRQRMENLRQAQRARAMGTVAATAQGALFSTGLQGGRGQVSGQTGVNQLGINQNLEIGRNIFAQNALVSQGQLANENLRLSLARQQASLQTRDTQLKSLYAQTQAGATSDYYGQSAAATSAYSAQSSQATGAYSAANAALQQQYSALGGSMSYLQGQISAQQGQAAIGAGQIASGQSLIGAGASIFQAGATFANIAPSLFNPSVTPTVQATGNSTYP